MRCISIKVGLIDNTPSEGMVKYEYKRLDYYSFMVMIQFGTCSHYMFTISDYSNHRNVDMIYIYMHTICNICA